jgi:sec-independent protein translocase protein TatB
MFESIGFSEMLLIGIIALVVVGPKDLPLLMRKAGQMMNRVRGMAADFRASFDDMARQAELDELRKEVEALKTMQPLHDIKEEFEKPFDFDGHGNQTIHLGPVPDKTQLAPMAGDAAPLSVADNLATTSDVQPETKTPKPPRKRAPKVKAAVSDPQKLPEQTA